MKGSSDSLRMREPDPRETNSIPANAPDPVGHRFELLIGALTEFVIVLLDDSGRFITWHPGVEEQFGYTQEEFIGQYLDLLLPPAERGRGISERELRIAKTAGYASDTRWLAKKGGKVVFAEGLTIAVQDSATQFSGFGKLIHDVTERREAEDQSRALARALEQSTVVIKQWDGTIEHWTAGCERLFGWTAQEAVGRNIETLLNTVFPMPLEQIQAQLLASGSWYGELRQSKRDGSPLFTAAQWVLLSGGAGEPHSIIGTYTDVSSRLQMQQELERANAQLVSMAHELERSNEELEEFARIASHDLSAPIMTTRWLVDLLSTRHAGNLDPEGQKCLKQISSGLERMADLVEAVLEHARVGTSAIGSSETTPAEQTLRAAIENLTSEIQSSGASIDFGPLPDISIQPQPLVRLFQNLLSNAIKYRRSGVTADIIVTAEWQNPLWKIAVADNGMGIEPEWLERIFQPLQRRHGLDIAGSGIGLATCRKIVTRAGGKIWVESVVGSGSTFYFTVPGPPPSKS